MTVPDHLKITGPEDILGVIPHTLGYWPANSLVAMTVQGTRLGATLRVDLPEPSRCRGPALAAFVRTVRGYLAADHEADGSLLAIFTGLPGDDGAEGGGGTGLAPAGSGAAGLDRLLRELEDTLCGAGLPVRDAWLVGERYWRNAHCIDPECCPRPGRPIEEIRDSRLNAELVFRGSSIGAAPGTAAPDVRPGAGRPAALQAEAGWAREFAGRWRDRAQFDAVLDVWECVLGAPARPRTAPPLTAGPPERVPLPADLAGYLRATLCVPVWRDAVLVMAAAGRPAALAGAEDFGMFDDGSGSAAPLPDLAAFAARAQTPTYAQSAAASPDSIAPAGPPAAGHSPADTSDPDTSDADADTMDADATDADGCAAVPGYGEVLLGLEPPVPHWAWLAGLERILADLSDCGSGEARAASLTARGWIQWCRGRGSFADALFTAAAEEQPGYRLAELLAELGRRGTLCGWARRKDSAWRTFDPGAL